MGPSRNAPCWCGSGKKLKRCHLDRARLVRPAVRIGAVRPERAVPEGIARPHYVLDGTVWPPPEAQVLSGEALERMRHACRVAAEVLAETVAAVGVGVTTDELDAVAHEAYVTRGAYPSTLGYHDYPKSICTSVNEVLCHGIPDDRPLQDGDIVNVDVTAFVDGMHGDTSATVGVGTIAPELAVLIDTTRDATLAGIANIRPGEPMQRVAEAVTSVAKDRGYGVVSEYGGHGIGEVFHADPHIHHTITSRDRAVAVPGLCLTVEPMLRTGAPRFTTADDGWTEVLDDGMPSAQFEHTVVVTGTGAEILTVLADGTSAVSPAGSVHAPAG
ncbi:type I methionyl aminopeptidase [Dermatobacter hominis]|uniref:type I methionyl aminopeptidase n=1 Tax=Dermatobacter hominis TaxID=2884263 RepID=UPI001D12A7A9|nr:type I methionyl aminopeptidase [Dermatobacter hominis]UDY34326.1 type I methionyl aminopeptidase [Dermatobacter hominis]